MYLRNQSTAFIVNKYKLECRSNELRKNEPKSYCNPSIESNYCLDCSIASIIINLVKTTKPPPKMLK
ncbi:hypothetical protein bcgnr5394_27390 [Bacillus cereus]|nr:hypothetical protein BCJMU10_0313 [Bacillus cereus]